MANVSLTIPYFEQQGLWLDYRKDIRGNSFTWAWERSTKDVQYVVLHHSVTNIRSDWTGVEGAKKYADEIANFHIDGRGWGGIGYHFLITPDGTLVYVGDISTARANVANVNEKVVGVCMIGDFTKHLPTDKQITSAHELTWWFDGQRSVWTNLKSPWDVMFIGHKEANVLFGNPGTACPGSSYPVDMKERIKNNIVYTPQPPAPVEPGDPNQPPEPEPTPTPPTDPSVPSDCCDRAFAEIEALKNRVSLLEQKNLWDLIFSQKK